MQDDISPLHCTRHCKHQKKPQHTLSASFQYDCSFSVGVYISLGTGLSLELDQGCLVTVANRAARTPHSLVVADCNSCCSPGERPPAFLSHSPSSRHTLCFCLDLPLSSTTSRGVEGCLRGRQADTVSRYRQGISMLGLLCLGRVCCRIILVNAHLPARASLLKFLCC